MVCSLVCSVGVFNGGVPSPPPLPPGRPDLRERYGLQRRRSDWIAPALLLALLALAVGLFVQGAANRAGQVRGAVSSYGAITSDSIEVTVEVVRPRGTAVACDVAAVGEGQLDVGIGEVRFMADGPARVRASTVVETAAPPLGARLLECRGIGSTESLSAAR